MAGVGATVMARPDPRERRVAATELQRLLAACEAIGSRWLPAVIQLAVETGMRRSELLAMRWDDVDLEVRTVLLRNTKTVTREPCRFHLGPSTSSEASRERATPCSLSRPTPSGLHGSA